MTNNFKSQWMAVLTSAGANAQRSPRAAATLWPSELGRSRITALAPWLTSRSTVALPKPEAPPVTSPTIPLEQGTKQGHVKSFSGIWTDGINHFQQDEAQLPSTLLYSIIKMQIIY